MQLTLHASNTAHYSRFLNFIIAAFILQQQTICYDFHHHFPTDNISCLSSHMIFLIFFTLCSFYLLHTFNLSPHIVVVAMLLLIRISLLTFFLSCESLLMVNSNATLNSDCFTCPSSIFSILLLTTRKVLMLH